MSRWQEEFNNHSFQAQWLDLKKRADSIVLLDETITTDVEELARLRKVVTYIDNLLISADPELLPANIWENSNIQTSKVIQQLNEFSNNYNIGHLRNANNHLDNILSYIRPYVVSTKDSAKAAGRAFNEYSRTVRKCIDTLNEETGVAIESIENYKAQAEAIFTSATVIQEKIKNYESFLFIDSDNEDSLESRIEELYKDIKDQYNKIEDYHDQLTKGDEEESAIILQIETAKNNALDHSNTISDALKDTEDKLAELKNFYNKIYGKENDNGEVEGGLQKELITRSKDLEDFKTKQQKAYAAALEEINSLLPGATSAGLATAYRQLKVSAERQVRKYTHIFYKALALLGLAAFYLSIKKVGWVHLELVEATGIEELFKQLMYKLPLIAPILWLALFSSKRRSEFQRLQQEYAHKEALAKSYQSFKKQINELGEDHNTLMAKLLDTAISAVAFNASATLDGKHGDKIPIQEVGEAALNTLRGKQAE